MIDLWYSHEKWARNSIPMEAEDSVNIMNSLSFYQGTSWISILSGWWFQPLWKIFVKLEYSSQYGKIQIMFQTTNQLLNTGILMNLELLGIIFSDTSKVPAARAARARQSPDPPTALPESAERRRPGRLRKATTTGRMGGRRLPIWGLYNDWEIFDGTFIYIQCILIWQYWI